MLYSLYLLYQLSYGSRIESFIITQVVLDPHDV